MIYGGFLGSPMCHETSFAQVRCNRLLWSYEATRIEAEHDHAPWFWPREKVGIGPWKMWKIHVVSRKMVEKLCFF